MKLVFLSVMPVHLQVKNLPCRRSAQISVPDALFVTAPYRLHRSVRKHTEWQDMPQSGAAASRFGKSPDGVFCSTCGKNLHGFHKYCFYGRKIEPPVYGLVRQARLLYASVRRFCVPVAGSTADFTFHREMLHGAHKQKRFLRMESKTAVQSVRRVRQF